MLIALALIFLPIIFDGQGSYDTQIASRIPEPPAIKPFNISPPTRPVIESSLPPADADTPAQADDEQPQIIAASEPNENEAAQPPEESAAAVVTSQPSYVRPTPELGPDGLPQGWSVRLATFSDRDNAASLQERLLNAGYKAYSRTLEREQGQLTAVYVGPWLDRARVDDYLNKLQIEFNLAGIIERYTIEPL